MKVIIIDDEKAMHLIMTKMLSKLPDIEIAGCFSDTASASGYIEEHDVHVAFVDISMPRESGMQFAERMALRHPHMYIIFVTSHKDYALDAFELSALDYIVKPVSLKRIEKSVIRAREMHQLIETTQTGLDTNSVQCEQEILTQKEIRVVQLISTGMSNKQIANELNVSAETIKSHIKNVYRKLNVNNRIQALQALSAKNYIEIN